MEERVVQQCGVQFYVGLLFGFVGMCCVLKLVVDVDVVNSNTIEGGN